MIEDVLTEELKGENSMKVNIIISCLSAVIITLLSCNVYAQKPTFGNYQLSGSGIVIWKINTLTGALSFCERVGPSGGQYIECFGPVPAQDAPPGVRHYQVESSGIFAWRINTTTGTLDFCESKKTIFNPRRVIECLPTVQTLIPRSPSGINVQ